MKEDSQLDPYDYMDCINWEYDPPSPLLFPLPPFAPALSNPSDSSKRPSFKNKYLNKIKHSVGERSTNSKAGLPPESEGSKGDKRVRNRVAAKESRDRKKMYIEIMEAETRQMEEELKETSK